MEPIAAASKHGRFSSYERLVAIGLAVLAVISPLFMDMSSITGSELDEEPFHLAAWFPLLLFILVLAIFPSLHLDQSLAKFDPYWIHRVGGSSCGIVLILAILFLVLKFKASIKNWQD